jgi:heme oxygenase (biliverdin-IX-beta and delta-forming)
MDLRSLLKESTASAHHSLDGLFSGIDLTQRDDYAKFIAAHALALCTLEQVLEAQGIAQIFPPWPEHRRSDALQQDLQTLGLQPPNLPESGLPTPILYNEAQCVGALYVLEGSRFGGRMMLERVLSSDDPIIRQATAFLSHGQGGGMWPRFMGLLSTNAAAHDYPEETVEGALIAFRHVHTYLSWSLHQTPNTLSEVSPS